LLVVAVLDCLSRSASFLPAFPSSAESSFSLCFGCCAWHMTHFALKVGSSVRSSQHIKDMTEAMRRLPETVLHHLRSLICIVCVGCFVCSGQRYSERPGTEMDSAHGGAAHRHLCFSEHRHAISLERLSDEFATAGRVVVTSQLHGWRRGCRERVPPRSTPRHWRRSSPAFPRDCCRSALNSVRLWQVEQKKPSFICWRVSLKAGIRENLAESWHLAHSAYGPFTVRSGLGNRFAQSADGALPG